MAQCSVCECVHRLEVDQSLVQGVSCRAVAAKYGLSKSAVERHKNGHLRPSLAAGNIMGSDSKPVPVLNPKYPGAAPAEDAEPDLSLLAMKRRLGRLIDKLDKAVSEAADTGTFQGLSAVGGQLIKAVDRVCVLENYYPEKAPAPGPTMTAGFAVQIIMPPGAGAPGSVTAIGTMAAQRQVETPEAPIIDIAFDGLGLPAPQHIRDAAARFGADNHLHRDLDKQET